MEIFTSLRRQLSLVALLVFIPAALFAKKEEWTDLQGNRFKGEASQIMGPFAVFRTDNLHGRRCALDQLSPETCIRFAKALATQPARADIWSEAKSDFTSELLETGCRQKDGKLVPEQFGRIVEPEVLVVAYMTSGNGDAWRMLGSAAGALNGLMKEFPGLVDGLFFGFGNTEDSQREMVKAMGWPGLVQKVVDQSSSSVAARFMSAGVPNIVVLSRQGVPLFVLQGESDEDVASLMKATKEFLKLVVSDNPKSWAARAHYARVVRPVLYADSEAGPLLMGNPLRADALVQRKISLLQASLLVDPQGQVTRVDFAAESDVPEDLRTPLAEALRKASVFAPAISKGQAVERTYSYRMDVRGKSGKTELSDLVGARDISIKEWLVLKPIKVEQQTKQSKLEYNGELDDGTLLLKPVYVGSELKGAPDYASQKKAFLTDWFDLQPDGAGNLHPKEGDSVSINGVDYFWKRLITDGQAIDFQKGNEGRNWVIAYAYAELDSPVACKAYFGFGSDDCARVWVNGKKVHEIWANRPTRADDDLFPVILKAGRNQILVKVQNFLMPQWGMHLHVLVP